MEPSAERAVIADLHQARVLSARLEGVLVTLSEMDPVVLEAIATEVHTALLHSRRADVLSHRLGSVR